MTFALLPASLDRRGAPTKPAHTGLPPASADLVIDAGTEARLQEGGGDVQEPQGCPQLGLLGVEPNEEDRSLVGHGSSGEAVVLGGVDRSRLEGRGSMAT